MGSMYRNYKVMHDATFQGFNLWRLLKFQPHCLTNSQHYVTLPFETADI